MHSLVGNVMRVDFGYRDGRHPTLGTRKRMEEEIFETQKQLLTTCKAMPHMLDVAKVSK